MYCPNCARPMRLVETPKLGRYTYACTPGDMVLTVAFHDRLTALVGVPAHATDRTLGEPASVHCPRCASRMRGTRSPSDALSCTVCGLELTRQDFYYLVERHFHRLDVGPASGT
jgi:hypothetical protein